MAVGDLVGKKFSRLLILEEKNDFNKSRGITKCYCQCDCGNKKWITKASIKNGNSKSCGCLWKEVIKKVNTKHNFFGKAFYFVWSNMKARCNNKKDPNYHHYGGRGITYDIKWDTFEGFLEDMKNGYKEGLTLDRIDNNKGYCKENCRWATWTQQANNKRNNKIKSAP